MDCQRFVDELSKRYPVKNENRVADVIAYVRPFSDEGRAKLLQAVKENYDREFFPSIPALRAAISASGVHLGGEVSSDGFHHGFGGFLAFQCQSCKGLYPTSSEGPTCPKCGKRKTGNEILAVLNSKPNFLRQGGAA
jgi:hypothetical protein